MNILAGKNLQGGREKMKRIRNAVLALVCSTLLAGCGSIGGLVEGKAAGILGNDLDRTVQLAQAYGKPEVAKCAMFLQGALSSKDEVLAKIDALSKEEVNGLLSGALKAALMAELIRSLDDPAQRAAFEKGFRDACSAVAGDIMLDLARDAAKVAKRGK
jgi:predicted small secreted protein